DDLGARLHLLQRVDLLLLAVSFPFHGPNPFMVETANARLLSDFFCLTFRDQVTRRALIDRQLKALAARQNAQRRKAVNRARFVLGAAALERSRTDPGWFAEFCASLSSREREVVQDGMIAS